MAKPHEEMSRLFRSLESEDAGSQPPAGSAVGAAEQRWPLFKALAPQRPIAPPPLPEQARQPASPRQNPDQVRKQALDLPGISEKLALNLQKMAWQPTACATGLRTRETSSTATGIKAEPVPDQQQKQAVTLNNTRRPLFSGIGEASLKTAQEDSDRTGVLAARDEPRIAAGNGLRIAADAGRSLSSIFNRLENREDPDRKPAENRRSLLGRLGRR